MTDNRSEIEKQEWVYSQLEDEQSKFIFEQRKQFNLDKDYSHIQKIVERYVPELSKKGWHPGKEKELIHIIQEKEKRVIIFGAGYYGEKLLDLCIDGGVTVDFFCDNDERKQNTIIQGIRIISLKKLEELSKNTDYVIIISTKYFHDEIQNLLVDIGISNNNIYKFVDYWAISLGTQYFDEDILPFKQNEVFVDGGCFNFWTSRLFLKKMAGLGIECKKIYAFEPDSKNIKKCKEHIESLDINNVEFIEAGLWSYNTFLQFSSEGKGSSHIVLKEERETEKIKVAALDSCVVEPVTFIKLDIEGAELEALKGAEHTIKRYRPKLAICIYHKPEDIWEIPYYIKMLVPEYKLYIRHYSNSESETVLYAV